MPRRAAHVSIAMLTPLFACDMGIKRGEPCSAIGTMIRMRELKMLRVAWFEISKSNFSTAEKVKSMGSTSSKQIVALRE
jgi:hypothetical protein